MNEISTFPPSLHYSSWSLIIARDYQRALVMDISNVSARPGLRRGDDGPAPQTTAVGVDTLPYRGGYDVVAWDTFQAEHAHQRPILGRLQGQAQECAGR